MHTWFNSLVEISLNRGLYEKNLSGIPDRKENLMGTTFNQFFSLYCFVNVSDHVCTLDMDWLSIVYLGGLNESVVVVMALGGSI